MEKECSALDALVSLSFGRTVLAKNMTDSGWNVLGWNNTNLIKSTQTNYLDKGIKQCVELRLQDDRTVTFTKDHKLLTSTGVWKRIQDLDLEKDKIKVGVQYPLLDIEKEMTECNKWSLQFGSRIIKTDTTTEFIKALAFARIIGLLITDGHFTPSKVASLFLGHPLDVQQVKDDFQLFGISVTAPKKKYCYRIDIPAAFGKNIAQLDGIVFGNKTTQDAKLPKFILDPNCPKPIIREFLGGMFGGDGHTCCLGLRRGKRDILTSIGFSRSAVKSKMKKLEEYLGNIKKLLGKFNIKNITFRKPQQVINALSKEKTYELTMHFSIEELINFHKEIGFRYCCHKSQRLEAGVSYKRLRNAVTRQHNWMTNRVNELSNFKQIKTQNPTKKIGTKKYIAQAAKEVDKKEGLLHKYAIPTTHDITDHLIKGTKFGKFTSKSFPNAEEYLKDINAISWFNGNYGVDVNATGLPTMDLKVISIREVGERPVCDISVDTTNSFVANGVVAHNCMIAHGMAQFLKERMVNVSDIYHVHVCSSCGLFARKKPDKNIYQCQMCTSRGLNYTTYKIEIPYAFKLLTQELMAINILPRIRVKSNVYDDEASLH